MKKFDFRRKLNGMSLEELKSFRGYYLDWMFKFMELDDKEFDKHLRYVGYIDQKIKKLENI